MHAASEPNSGTVPLLSMRDISIDFGGVAALKKVSFDVLPGEIHCLAGENGSGKSTLIKIITGVYRPLYGAEIQYDGQVYSHMSPVSAQQRGIRVIWQDLALFAEMTVAENIAIQQVLTRWPNLVDYHRMREVAEEALGRLGVELDVDRPLREYQIAQRQIVAIARSLVGEAKLIFMDEPTASLTQSETDHLLDIIRTLSAAGVSVVFVSHRLAEVLEISDRITVLRDGKLVGVYPAAGMTQSRVTELMTGRTFQHHVRSVAGTVQPTVLEIKGLTRPGEFEEISFTLRQGETLGITGLLGSGRTELALTLFGMSAVRSGSIVLDGQELRLRSNRDAIRAGIAYLSEDRLSLGLIQPQSIADNLVIASLDRIMRRGFLSEQRKAGVVTKWVSELGIKIGRPQNPVSNLSGGNQQRIAIAKWLATNPRVLILDCPTVGVDVGARAGIFEIVAELAESGLAIILISDEVSEVYFHSDRVLHMVRGRVVNSYDPKACTLQELEAAVYA
jgi:simple sugar transport system ATP-binding protein